MHIKRWTRYVNENNPLQQHVCRLPDLLGFARAALLAGLGVREIWLTAIAGYTFLFMGMTFHMGDR
jgi:hypothetical protein